MESALKVNCLQVQEQSNSIDCGVFAIAFAVDVCFGLPPNESCYDVIEMCNHLSTCLQLQELSPFPRISTRGPRWRHFQQCIDIFCVCRQNFFMSDIKESASNFKARCSISCDWFHKKCMSITKKVFSSEDEHKKGSVVTAKYIYIYNLFIPATFFSLSN